MTNANITIEEAIAQYEEAIEKEYVTDGKVDRDDVWTFTNLLMSIEVLLAVAIENGDDEESVELFEKVANTDNMVKKVVHRIAEDDHILGDWMDNTDYHVYNEWVMTIVENFIEMLDN